MAARIRAYARGCSGAGGGAAQQVGTLGIVRGHGRGALEFGARFGVPSQPRQKVAAAMTANYPERAHLLRRAAACAGPRPRA